MLISNCSEVGALNSVKCKYEYYELKMDYAVFKNNIPFINGDNNDVSDSMD